MKRSIRNRIMLLFIGLMAAMLFGIWAVNNWWLEGYYTNQKLRVLEDAYEKLDAVVMDKIGAGENIGDVITEEAKREWQEWSKSQREDSWGNSENTREDEAKPGNKRSKDESLGGNKLGDVPLALEDDSLLYSIREYGEKNNIAIVLIDSTTGRALVSSAREGEWLAQKVQRYILEKDGVRSQVLADHENYAVEKNYDPRAKSEYLESWGFFSDNSTLFIMSMPLASISESVALSNRFTTYAGLVVLVIGSVFIYFLTRRVTDPLMKLAALSERMSHLDFEASYEGDAEDEVGVLGRSMNTLSHKLKETIGELKKDIEEKIQIDEMRKEFIANVSHELKTPIALIQGYAEGLAEGMCEDEESRSYYCEVITDESAKMNKMVKQLLTLSALEFGSDTPTKERFDITELIGDWLNSAQILIQQKDATVIYEPTEAIFVQADEFKIEEVVANYINNAMNHLSGDRMIHITVKQEDGVARVGVFNTGTPIPEEDIPNLWTKFYKVDKARTRDYGGSGIGLSIVKAIVEAHKQQYGMINLKNGVEFWFTLERDQSVSESSD